MNNEKREERGRREDAVLNRVLIWFGAAVAAEFVMLLLNRYYINYTTASADIMLAAALRDIMPPLILVGLIGTVVCFFWYFTARKKNGKTVLPLVLGLIFAAILVCFGVTWRFSATGVQFLCGAIPVVAVLALVFYLYQKEFFTVTVLGVIGILGLWIIRKAAGGHVILVYAYVAAAALAMLAAAALLRTVQKGNGTWGRGEKKLHIFPRNANYGLLYLTCGIVAVVLIAACFLGTGAAYYLIFALVAWLFVMAVYYTVKLM